jgi:nitrogen regulatory protein PII
MKLIKTVVPSYQVDEVRNALAQLRIADVTVTDVRRDGRQQTAARGSETDVSVDPNVLIELVVCDELVADATQAILRSARTGALRNGRVSVLPLDQGVEN